MFDRIYRSGELVNGFCQCCVEVVDNDSWSSYFADLDLITVKGRNSGAVSQNGDKFGCCAGLKVSVVSAAA